jgi:hypothetical protein
VELAADALLREGERPTIEKIREKIGRGSPNTVNPLLDGWWKRLSSRLDAGPAALHRLPETVAHVAEALWMQALDEGRRRAEQELARQTRSVETRKDTLEVRSHVLTLREGELDSRLRDRERTQASLESRLHELSLLLRKEQATREAQARRIASLEQQLLVSQASGITARPKTPGRATAFATASRARASSRVATRRPKTGQKKKKPSRARRR